MFLPRKKKHYIKTQYNQFSGEEKLLSTINKLYSNRNQLLKILATCVSICGNDYFRIILDFFYKYNSFMFRVICIYPNFF